MAGVLVLAVVAVLLLLLAGLIGDSIGCWRTEKLFTRTEEDYVDMIYERARADMENAQPAWGSW